MHKELTKFGPDVTLVADSTLQFLDFGLSLGTSKGPSFNFAETPDAADSTQLRLRKLSIDPDSETLFDVQNGEEVRSDATYSVNLAYALDLFNDTWLPMPYFKSSPNARSEGTERFEKGPTLWSRLRVVKLEAPDEEDNTHRVTVGFDTRTEQRRKNTPYTIAAPSDVTSNSQFEFASQFSEFSWFLDEHWVIGWLKDLLADALESGNVRALYREDENEAQLAYWAAYITLIEGLAETIDLPNVRFLITMSEDKKAKPEPPFDVDLVLDIGNARTCGVLVEHNKEGRLGLDNAKRLEIRDLEKLEFAYSKPFQSRVEFRDVSFGIEKWPKQAGGKDTLFKWPSFLRLGSEARRLNSCSAGTEGLSGLSAPKRYLWDDASREQQWSFNTTGKQHARPEIVGKLMRHLTEAGDLVSRERAGSYAYRAKFSRASLFSLKVMEVLLQAIRQINEPAYRWSTQMRNVPRRLRRIILTIPSATPIVEQREFQKRAQDGLDLIWEQMEWDDIDNQQFEKPSLRISYDEASCTQLVYLYSEIMDRYQRSAQEFLSLKSDPQSSEDGKAQLRIASIDIGGGTTDLMIGTYTSSDDQPHQLRLEQNFREGFRLAGDDVIQQVISQHVLYAIAQDLRSKGIPNPGNFLSTVMNATNADAKTRQRRVLFVNQVLAPLAYSLLGVYERAGLDGTTDGTTFDEAFEIGTIPPNDLTDFFDEAAQAAGAEEFKLRNVKFPLNAKRMNKTIADVVEANLRCLTDIVAAYQCDYLLVTGRPSRLPAIRNLVLAAMAVLPHRVVFMHEYSIGDWYPFSSAANVIGDPKTTVAVGALICALAEDSLLTNFSLPPKSFSLLSTANVVGLMDISGALTDSGVLFRKDETGNYEKATDDFLYSQPVILGFRQIDRSNWPATPLFRLHIPHAKLDDALRSTLPWRIELSRPELSENAIRRGETEDETFRIETVTKKDGTELMNARSRLKLQLQTMFEAEGFWTDTGNIQIPSDL